ncbi:reverse transcriptase domain-containing protein [Tanacetum coccineum]
MVSKAVARRVEIETKQDIGEVESKQVTSTKAPASRDHMSVGIKVKQDMSATVAETKSDLFLDQLQVDVTGTVVVMIGRKWDVNAVTGRYLSTNFVVSDAKGNGIHYTARSNVAHNFLRLKEGGIYSIKNFVVHRNKEEYRIRKNDSFMIEFDRATSIPKAFVKADGFVCYPLQLMDFDGIKPTENKYLIDVAGYITNVGRTNRQKTGSRNLDFYLANHRVTLWGALGDVLIEKKSKQAGMCPIVLTSANEKYYNNKLYLSSSSSTMIFDDADIPAVKALITNMPASGEESKKLSVHTAIFHCKVRIANVRTRKGWNFSSCGGENFLRYMLELDIADDTANAVVVMFDEPATTLVRCSAESVMEDDDESSDDQSNLPPTLANLIGTTHTLKIKSHTYYEYGTFESFTCWIILLTEGVVESASSSTLDAEAATKSPKLKSLSRDPVYPHSFQAFRRETNQELILRIQTVRIEAIQLCMLLTRKKGMVIEDYDAEDNCGSAEGGPGRKIAANQIRKEGYGANAINSSSNVYIYFIS